MFLAMTYEVTNQASARPCMAMAGSVHPPDAVKAHPPAARTQQLSDLRRSWSRDGVRMSNGSQSRRHRCEVWALTSLYEVEGLGDRNPLLIVAVTYTEDRTVPYPGTTAAGVTAAVELASALGFPVPRSRRC